MDKRSQKNLSELHPKLRDSAIAGWTEAQAAMPDNVQIVVIDGYRTFAESDALYAQGRTAPGEIVTNSPGGSSCHNYALAFDFQMITNGKVDYSVGPLWMKVVEIMKAHGFTWGGDFIKIKDAPHFENKFGYGWRDLLAKHNAQDFIKGTTFVNI